MIVLIAADTRSAWLETENWVLRGISIILMLSYIYYGNVTNSNLRKITPISKCADVISAKLKSMPVLNKWTYFDWFQSCVMGLNIYFAWAQTENTSLQILSIVMLVAYVLLRSGETLTGNKD